MNEQYRGIQKIGYWLNQHLPLTVFKSILRCYHKMEDVAEWPKAKVAKILVGRRIAKIRNGNKPIRFGFYVVLDSMFQQKHVFELMLKDDRFDPFIVVVPRRSWSLEDMRDTVEKTFIALAKEFGDRVLRGYADGMSENYISRCDACSMMNIYRGLSLREFEPEYFACHGIPVFASAYMYDNGTIHYPEYFSMSTFRFIRMFFVANKEELGHYKRYQRVKDTEGLVKITGCPKSDVLKFEDEPRKGDEKVVLLAPHHSVIPSVDSGICIGNFLRYKDLMLSLPIRYPNIRWIFRPHPHLKFRLTKDVGRPMSEWDDYIRRFTSNKNAEYEEGGSYYDSFDRSDAIIQDCGSFLPEYFYTGKPCCYMLASQEAKQEQFDEWGQELLAHTYQAFSEEDITRFIDDVVIGGKDTMREMRHKFAKERVMINYPHASEAILEDIAETLGRGPL